MASEKSVLSLSLDKTHRALDRWPPVAWWGWLNARRRMGTLWLGNWTLRENGQRSNGRTKRRTALQCLCAAIFVTFTRSQLIVDCLTNRVAHEQEKNCTSFAAVLCWALFSLPSGSSVYYRARDAILAEQILQSMLTTNGRRTLGWPQTNRLTEISIARSLCHLWPHLISIENGLLRCTFRTHCVHIREFVTKFSTENELLSPQLLIWYTQSE